MLCEQCNLDDRTQPFDVVAVQCDLSEGYVAVLVLFTGLLCMLCEECESEHNSYELSLPASMCGKKLMGPNGQSL